MSNNSNNSENSKGSVNVVEEMEQSSGEFVKLGDFTLPEGNGDETIFSNNWNIPKDKSFGAPVNHFSSFTAAGKENDETEEIDSEQTKSKPAPTATVEKTAISNRERVEKAINGEEPKSTNPRMVKAVIAVVAVIALCAVFFLSFNGEKRKSYLSKNTNANTATDQASSESTSASSDERSSSTGDSESSRRSGSLKFGDVQVGTDPNNTSSAAPDNSNQQSTEDAKNTEETTPSVTPTPYNNSFTPSYAGYGSTGGSSYGSYQNSTGSGMTTSPTQTPAGDDENVKNQAPTKNRRGDLADTSLGMETDEQRFKTVLRAGQGNKRGDTPNAEQVNNAAAEMQNNSDLPKGSRLELLLEEPIRSGIATAVTARLKKGIVNKKGETIIPKDSMVVVQFSAEVANGRVFNEKQSPIQIVTPDGRNFAVSGIVKDAQGFAGLTGKITKVGGRSAISKIGGVLGRVGNVLPGGQIITGAQQGIDGATSSDYVTNATQIVEIPRGTSFMVIVGF